MFFQYVKRVIFLIPFLSMYVLAFSDVDQPTTAIKVTNKFNDISIKLIEQGDIVNCHKMVTQDKYWQRISFDQIPQHKHFCMRAWIDIDNSHFTPPPSLLVAMLAASSLYWDEKPISQNGKVGASVFTEKPGIIKTLVSIPQPYLTNGSHLLSGEISTFHLRKKLKGIGYILALVDERELNSQILILSIFSAIFIGISFVLAILFQLIYWLYQKEISYQIFSFFCLSSSLILVAEQAKFWLNYTYDWHIFRISLIYSLTLLASSLLPLFYLVNYRLPRRKRGSILIVLGLMALSFANLSYDQTSSFLFSGALIAAFIINAYMVFHLKKGQVNLFLILLSLLFLYFIPDYFNELGFSIVFMLIVMAMLVSLIKEMHTNKIEALKAERIKTELLRRNMQPHFLMNCLTQLMELIEVAPKKAVEFISVLSDEFRQLTAQSIKDKISLAEEITLCNKHLAIMSFRYQQSYQLRIIGDIAGISIPPTILHSQIENCFTHNEISSNRAFELTITHINGQIDLTLKTPIEKRIDHQGTGLGERYIKARLAEFEQIAGETKKPHPCSFKSYEECQYWVSKFSFN